MRLLVLAHVRGLLKPNYPHGIKSIIREELLLRQISRETYGTSYYHRAGVEASLINAMSPRDRDAVYKRATTLIMEGAAMHSFYSQEALERIRNKDQIEVKQGAAVLKIIDQSNLFDVLSKAVKPEDFQ